MWTCPRLRQLRLTLLLGTWDLVRVAGQGFDFCQLRGIHFKHGCLEEFVQGVRSSKVILVGHQFCILLAQQLFACQTFGASKVVEVLHQSSQPSSSLGDVQARQTIAKRLEVWALHAKVHVVIGEE